MTYREEVEAQVERNDGAGGWDGWDNGAVSICEEVGEELIDTAAWLRGLDQYPMTAEQQTRIDTIVGDAELLFEAVRELRETYVAGS